MKNGQFIEFTIAQLEEALQNLNGVEGVRGSRQVIQECMDSVDGFKLSIPLLRNNHFELEYNVDKQVVEFRTTYSNQDITPEYMNEMSRIHLSMGHLESLVKTLVKLYEES